MLDGWVRKQIDPELNRLGGEFARAGVSANALTFSAFGIGLAAAFAISQHQFVLGLLLMLISRIGDGLDGAVAKIRGETDLGGYLDIVLDFVFYGAIPFGFVLADPVANAAAGALLVFSFYANGASFLAYAVMAEKRGMKTNLRGSKSLYFTAGLAEATETIAVFVLFCLFPAWFPQIAIVFAALCFITAAGRIALAIESFR